MNLLTFFLRVSFIILASTYSVDSLIAMKEEEVAQAANDFLDELADECRLEHRVYEKEREIAYRFKYLMVKRDKLISQVQELGEDVISQQIKNIELGILKFENELRSMLPKNLQIEVDRFQSDPYLSKIHTKTWQYLQAKNHGTNSPLYILTQIARDGNQKAWRLLLLLSRATQVEFQQIESATDGSQEKTPVENKPDTQYTTLSHEQLKELDPAIISIRGSEISQTEEQKQVEAEAKHKTEEKKAAQERAAAETQRIAEAAEAKRKAKQQKQAEAEAKRKAEEAAAQRKAEEKKAAQERAAAEAKRRAEEAELKRKEKEARRAEAASVRVEEERKQRVEDEHWQEAVSHKIEALAAKAEPFAAGCEQAFLEDVRYQPDSNAPTLSSERDCYSLTTYTAYKGDIFSALRYYVVAEYTRASMQTDIPLTEMSIAKKIFEKILSDDQVTDKKKHHEQGPRIEVCCALAALSFTDAIRCLVRRETPDKTPKSIRKFLEVIFSDTDIFKLKQKKLRLSFAMVLDTIATLAYSYRSIIDGETSLKCQRIACALYPDSKIFKLHLGRILTEIIPGRDSMLEGVKHLKDLVHEINPDNTEEILICADAAFRLGILFDPKGPVVRPPFKQDASYALELVKTACLHGYYLADGYFFEMSSGMSRTHSFHKIPVPHLDYEPEPKQQLTKENACPEAASSANAQSATSAHIPKNIEEYEDILLLETESFEALMQAPDAEAGDREYVILGMCKAAQKHSEFTKIAYYLARYLEKFALTSEITKAKLKEMLTILQEKQSSINDKKFNTRVGFIKNKLA